MSTLVQQEEAKRSQKFRKRLLLLLVATLGVTLLSFWIGYYPLSPKEVLQAFMSGLGVKTGVTPQAVTIFWRVRFPRVLAALLIGAALSTSGAVYQGMFQNPLVSPDILGASQGAGLGASLAIFMRLSHGYIQGFAFIGGLIAVLLATFISRKAHGDQVLSLVLVGTMISALCNSGITMIKYLAEPSDMLQEITFWLMGSLSKVSMVGILWSLVPMTIGFIIVFALRWRINLLSLSDEEARSLGINPQKYRLLFIFAATLMSASAVCLGGLIAWVGLMVPHMARRLFGSDYGRLIPGCLLLGAVFLLIMDDIARSLLTLELPIGVVSSLMGAPFFVALIIKRKES